MELYNIPSVITIKLTLHSVSVKPLIVETTFSSKYLEVFSVHSRTKFHFKLSSLAST